MKLESDAKNVQLVASSTALNHTDSNVASYVDNSTVNATRNVIIDALAETTATFSAILPGFSASTQTKDSQNKIRNTIDAHISNGSSVTADDMIGVVAPIL